MKYETRLSDLYQKDNPELFQEVLDFAEKNAIDKSMIEDVVVTREVIPCVKEIALEKEQKHKRGNASPDACFIYWIHNLGLPHYHQPLHRNGFTFCQ